MTGPCLCGDPCCASCGDPEYGRIEAAEEFTLDAFGKARFTAEEYQIAVAVGIAAVLNHRKILKIRMQEHEAAYHALSMEFTEYMESRGE